MICNGALWLRVQLYELNDSYISFYLLPLGLNKVMILPRGYSGSFLRSEWLLGDLLGERAWLICTSVSITTETI